MPKHALYRSSCAHFQGSNILTYILMPRLQLGKPEDATSISYDPVEQATMPIKIRPKPRSGARKTEDHVTLCQAG